MVAQEGQDPSWPKLSPSGLIIFSILVLVGIQLSDNLLQNGFFSLSPCLPLSLPFNSNRQAWTFQTLTPAPIWIRVVALGSDLQQANTEPRAHRNVPRTEILGRDTLCSLPRNESFPSRKTFPPGAQAATKEEFFLMEAHLRIHVDVSVQKCQPCKKLIIHQKIKYSPKN